MLKFHDPTDLSSIDLCHLQVQQLLGAMRNPPAMQPPLQTEPAHSGEVKAMPQSDAGETRSIDSAISETFLQQQQQGQQREQQQEHQLAAVAAAVSNADATSSQGVQMQVRN